MKKELIKLINRNDIISFDIFDTLILRNLYKPTDLFRILNNIVKKEHNISNFYEIRIESEIASRTDLNNYECNIDEIYDIIANRIKNKKLSNKIKEKELELEMKFCIENPFMKEIFNYCIEQKKQIILISDMYLKKDFISKLLEKNGYSKVELFISNEYHENKGTSKLFEVVYQKKKYNKSKWLHIGDNSHSDYNSPIKFGINAYNYKAVSSYSNYKPESIFESIILAIQNNYLYNGLERDYWTFFGVKYVAPIYFGFTKWLYDLTNMKDNLFFIARDGYIIEKIYKMFPVKEKMYTKYLYCSRICTQIPSLLDASKDKLVHLLTQKVDFIKEIPLKDFLTTAQVNLDEIADLNVLKSFEFSSLEDKVTDYNRKNAEKLVAYLYDNIKNNILPKKILSTEYLKQEGLDTFEKINIMDIGWGGSIQEAISKLLNKEVNGYYFGTLNQNKEDSFSNMFGYYFDLDEKQEDKEKILSQVMMYEFIFSAPHGSTIDYLKKDKKIIPVFNDDIKYNKVVDQFQKSALNIIDKILEYLDYFDNLDKHFCLKPYQDFLDRYDYEDMKMFSSLSNDLVLGSSQKYNYVNKISLENVLAEDDTVLEQINSSLWKNAYIIEGDFKNFKETYSLVQNKINHLKYKKNTLIPLRCAKIYFDYGNGFNEEDMTFVPYTMRDGKLYFQITIKDDVKAVRIDPIEGVSIKIRNLIIATNNGNVKCLIPKKDYITGKLNKCICIRSKDPRIIIKDMNNVNMLTFSANIEIL